MQTDILLAIGDKWLPNFQVKHLLPIAQLIKIDEPGDLAMTAAEEEV